MLLQELKAQVFKLPPNERLALASAIIESLQEAPIQRNQRTEAIQHMRGLLKIEQQAPTDEAVKIMLEERRAEKYLS
ncbi:MAG: hypothetical protein AAGC93_23580 [Cyanobacteria bacterium P01_F01_bin.53]